MDQQHSTMSDIWRGKHVGDGGHTLMQLVFSKAV